MLPTMAHSNAAQKMREISESSLAPKEAHLKALGKFTDVILHSKVLVMTYVRTAKTAGGIILTDVNQEEDRFQGKVGLVVAMGPGAFKDDGIAKFHGEKLKKHEWVLARPGDGLEMFFNGCTLRLYEDVNILARVADPVAYW